MGLKTQALECLGEAGKFPFQGPLQLASLKTKASRICSITYLPVGFSPWGSGISDPLVTVKDWFSGLPCCVHLGNSLPLSGPQFPCL